MKVVLGLRGKSILFTGLMAAVLGLVLGGYGYVQLRHHQMMELERWGISTATALARSSSYAVFTQDLDALEETARASSKEGDVLLVGFSDPEGVVLAWAGEESVAPSDWSLTAETRVSSREGVLGPFYEIRVPVQLFEQTGSESEEGLDMDGSLDEEDFGESPSDGEEDSTVGQVIVSVSHARVQGLLASALRTTALTTLGIMALAAVLATLYMTRVVKPITRMTEVARQMADGDLTREFDTTGGSDEVTTLATAFGRMKTAVREHTEALFRSQMEELTLANEEVMKSNTELLQVNRRKSAFLADMSHELRTPLNAIIGFSDMMAEGLVGDMNEEQEGCVSDILSSGRHLLTLINDILDIAKIEAGKADLATQSMSLVGLVNEAVTSTRGLAHQKGLDLQVDIEDGLDTIVADERRLKQVLLNLLSNAVKYTPAGWVRLTARRLHETPDALHDGRMEYLRVDVTDTGVGIPEDQRDRVFSEFDRVDNPYSRKQEGTGLGLALCQKLVEAHGGTIDFKSETDGGSTFFFTIPLGEVGPVESGEKRAAISGGQAPLVLVVEDDRGSANVVKRALNSAGYRSEVAATAAEAIIMARDLLPDLITLDVRLPDQDGWSVLRELRAMDATRSIPVVMMSGEDAEAKGLDLGASAYLVKPVHRSELIEQLEALVYRGEPGVVVAIDDDAGMRQWYERALGAAGWTVKVCASGPKGLELIREDKPDLVVLDLMMSGVSGFDVLKELRSDPEVGDVRVVVVSAKDLSPEETELLAGDVDRVLQKGSFNSRELVRGLLSFQAEAPSAQTAAVDTRDADSDADADGAAS